MNCIKIGFPGKTDSQREKVFGKSNSLENSLRESIFREDLFLYNCLQDFSVPDVFIRSDAIEEDKAALVQGKCCFNSVHNCC